MSYNLSLLCTVHLNCRYIYNIFHFTQEIKHLLGRVVEKKSKKKKKFHMKLSIAITVLPFNILHLATALY